MPTAEQIAAEFNISKRTASRDPNKIKYLLSELNKQNCLNPKDE